MTPTKSEGSEKFEGELLVTELAWEISSDGPDDEIPGHGVGGGYMCRLKRVKVHPPFADVTPSWRERLSSDDLAFLKSQKGGCILHVGAQGFVTGAWFDTEEEAEEAWRRCLESVHHREEEV